MIIKVPCEIGTPIEGYFGYQGYRKGYLAGITPPMGRHESFLTIADLETERIITHFQLKDLERPDNAYKLTHSVKWCQIELPFEWHEMCSLEPIKAKGVGCLVCIHYSIKNGKYNLSFMNTNGIIRRIEVDSLPIVK